MNVRSEDKKKIIDLICAVLPNATIYLYGSRARSDHSQRSDVDIAIDIGDKITFGKLGEVRSILDASNVIYRIDVVDYQSASGKFRTLIDKDKIVWKN